MERARRAGEEVMGHLAGENSRAAWRTLSGWYRAVEGKAGKPCYTRMEEQTVEREALYDYVPPSRGADTQQHHPATTER